MKRERFVSISEFTVFISEDADSRNLFCSLFDHLEIPPKYKNEAERIKVELLAKKFVTELLNSREAKMANVAAYFKTTEEVLNQCMYKWGKTDAKLAAEHVCELENRVTALEGAPVVGRLAY
jgi:hypothetical protein